MSLKCLSFGIFFPNGRYPALADDNCELGCCAAGSQKITESFHEIGCNYFARIQKNRRNPIVAQKTPGVPAPIRNNVYAQ